MPEHMIVGRLTMDYVVTADDRVHRGLIGGGLVYSAAGARVWSPSVGLVGRVGRNFPSRALKRLESQGFDLAGLQQVDRPLQHTTFFAYQEPTARLNGKPTSHFLRIEKQLPKPLLNYEAEAARMSRHELDALATILPGDIGMAKGAHLAPISWRRASVITSELRERGLSLLSLDPHSEYLQPGQHDQLKVLLRDVDAFLPSLTQARRLFQRPPSSNWEIAEKFADWGAKFVILKCGKEGQLVLDGVNDRRWKIPAYPVTVRDVTGAGHAFCGGFLVGLSSTGDPLEAALRGNVAASFAVEGVGPFYPLTSLPGLAEARLSRLRGAWEEA